MTVLFQFTPLLDVRISQPLLRLLTRFGINSIAGGWTTSVAFASLCSLR